MILLFDKENDPERVYINGWFIIEAIIAYVVVGSIMGIVAAIHNVFTKNNQDFKNRKELKRKMQVLSNKLVGNLGGSAGDDEKVLLNKSDNGGKPNNFALLRAAIAEKRKS